jgi:amino acid permease
MGFLGIGANIKDAMDGALESAGPNYDILVDGVVFIKQYPFWAGYEVEGTALSSKEIRMSMGEEAFNKWYASANVFIPEDSTTITED